MRIGVVGCGGRMGRLLVAEVIATEGVELAGAVARKGSAAIGQDAGLLAGAGPASVMVDSDAVRLFANADAVLDFTTPQSSVDYAALAAQGQTVHVIGTTGFNSEQHEAIESAARHTPIILASNTSMGVTLLMALVEKVAQTLPESYDIEIVEMHHRAKIDAPSGTALSLGRAAAAGRGVNFEDAAVMSRVGATGARADGAIGFAALRGGDVVGEHKVIFAGGGERVEIGHVATDRTIYARGAVRAALWARDRSPGLYSMRDVLDL